MVPLAWWKRKKANKYYDYNKERLPEQARNKYKELSNEKKIHKKRIWKKEIWQYAQKTERISKKLL